MFTSTSSTGKADLYEQVTQSIIQAIEDGAGDYVMPWHSLTAPVNAFTGKRYRGINVLLLWATAARAGYLSEQWATYRQWQEAGGQVRKGERSSLVVFWKFFDNRQEESQDDQEDAQNRHARCMARAYHVFNAAQVDGIPPSHALPDGLPESERIAHAEAFFSALPGKVIFGSEQAYYSKTEDAIHMPDFSRFKSSPQFYSVLSHERSHWCGAPTRLNRNLTGRFGDANYAMEELIAELTSALVCASLQLPLEPRKDHAPYLANWLQVLRGDKRAIFTAASKAQEAANYLRELVNTAALDNSSA